MTSKLTLTAVILAALAAPALAENHADASESGNGTWVAKSGAKRVLLWGPPEGQLVYRVCLDGGAPFVTIHRGDKSFNVFAGACMDVVVTKTSLVVENSEQTDATGTYGLVAQ